MKLREWLELVLLTLRLRKDKTLTLYGGGKKPREEKEPKEEA